MLRTGLLSLVVCLLTTISTLSSAASKTEIDAKSYAAVQILEKEVPGAAELIKKAYAMLIFPEVYGGGFGFGGEYGEGKMYVDDYTHGYYNLVSASFGFKAGAQVKSEAILFMTKEAFDQFNKVDGWEAGVDGSVAVVEFGAGQTLNTNAVQEPIIAFIFSNKGLMVDLSIEGSKISKIQR
jgi:lipid-binding SYLF domain-containing protein